MKEVASCGLCSLLVAVCLSACQGAFLAKTPAKDRDHQSGANATKGAVTHEQEIMPSPESAAVADSESSNLKLDYSRIPIRTAQRLEPLRDALTPRLSGKGQPLQVGIGRELPPPYSTGLQLGTLEWTKLKNGGQAAAISVTSSGAVSIRIALAQSRITEGIELRFFGGTNGSKVYGPYRRSDLLRAWSQTGTAAPRQFSEKSLFWSPVVDGQTIAIEIYLPAGSEPGGLALVAPVLSHLYR